MIMIMDTTTTHRPSSLYRSHGRAWRRRLQLHRRGRRRFRFRSSGRKHRGSLGRATHDPSPVHVALAGMLSWLEPWSCLRGCCRLWIKRTTITACRRRQRCWMGLTLGEPCHLRRRIGDLLLRTRRVSISRLAGGSG